MLNFCTLFDINYIAQGLSMYDSLKKNCGKEFILYILAMCDESCKFLKNLNLSNVKVVSLEELEDGIPRLKEAKKDRTKGEYCWTCASSLILYCIENYNLEQCTYLDADLYFYSDPKILLDEMGEDSVLITEHRYTPKYDQTATSGKYCVQFMSFENDDYGMQILNWWVDKCIDWCYARVEDNKFGDQKYLDDWLERFSKVHSLENIGGGVAPWNFEQYDFYKKNNKWYIREQSGLKEYPLIFYHYHDVKVENDGYFNEHKYYSYKQSDKRLNKLYKEYTKNLKKHNRNIKGLKRKPITLKQVKDFRKKFIRLKLGRNPHLSLFGIEIIK